MSQDLKHFGVRGMKWGKRKAQLKAWGREAGKLTKSSFTNPGITDKANRESIASEKTLGGKLRRSMLYQNTKDLKDVNQRIERMKSEKAIARKILLANKTEATGLGGRYKTSEDHAKDLVASWKAKDAREIALDLSKGAGKAAVEFTVGFVTVYGGLRLLEKVTRP